MHVEDLDGPAKVAADYRAIPDFLLSEFTATDEIRHDTDVQI
jgi:hypothetical protein